MTIAVYIPQGPLALFVDKLWYMQADSLPLRGINLPMLHTELIVNFSEHFTIQQADGQSLVRDQVSWVSGLQTIPSRSQTAGQHEAMGALLKPWGLYSLTGIPTRTFANRAVAAYDLFGSDFRDVVERLQDTPDKHEKLKLLNAFLVSRYADRDIPAFLFYASQYLHSQPFRDGIVGDLCAYLRISRKSLNEAFQKYMGLSTSQFVRLNRFRKATDSIAKGPTRKLTEIAYEHNFFDQAHFNRLFNDFAGMTPGNFQKAVKCGLVEPFEQSEQPVSPAFVKEPA
jgi:AraC-like DNA-binding protein